MWRKAATIVSIAIVLAVGGCSVRPVGPAPVIASTPEQAVQTALGRELRVPVTLEVAIRRRHADWVFLAGRPRDAAGGPIDYAQTPYAADWSDGTLDDHFMALTRHAAGGEPTWVVVELAVGATDAPFVDWFERHGLPLWLAGSGERPP